MSLNYSHLGNKGDAQRLYNNIWASQITTAKRKQLKSGMDDFTGFSWRGVNAFDNFGAFIINNKNSLKFYGGSTYSNQYTKPQFESSTGNLTGISFSTPKIDFTIGAYWISEDDYRQLIYWLNPYEISALTFDFEPYYYYQVKLASVEQSIRYIVGTEKNYDIISNFVNAAKTLKNTEDVIRFKSAINSTPFQKDRVYQISIKEEPENVFYAISDLFDAIDDLPIGGTVVFQNMFNNDFLNCICIATKVAEGTWRYEIYQDAYLITTLGMANEKDYRYYAEFKVSFEVQGPACAYHKIAYEFDSSTDYDEMRTGLVQTWTVKPESFHQVGNSNLEIPFNWYIPISLKTIFEQEQTLGDSITLKLTGSIYYAGQSRKLLFDTLLTNLSFLNSSDNRNWTLDLKYDSNSGLMFLELGNNDRLLLSRLSTVSTGKRIVNSITVEKHFLSGNFESYLFDLSQITLKLEIKAFDKFGVEIRLVRGQEAGVFAANHIGYIDMRARTNLI